MTDFVFLGSKITVDGDGSHEMRRHSFLGRETDKSRKHIKEQKITLTTKVYLVKAMVYPIVMYGCESWTIKTAEC